MSLALEIKKPIAAPYYPRRGELVSRPTSHDIMLPNLKKENTYQISCACHQDVGSQKKKKKIASAMEKKDSDRTVRHLKYKIVKT